jgi:hypothetical protein
VDLPRITSSRQLSALFGRLLKRDDIAEGKEFLETRYTKGLTLGGERSAARENRMCRNIKTLFNFEPPATDEEICATFDRH